jgi:hypothetical protein
MMGSNHTLNSEAGTVQQGIDKPVIQDFLKMGDKGVMQKRKRPGTNETHMGHSGRVLAL